MKMNLKALSDTDLNQVLQQALTDKERGLGNEAISLAADAEQLLLQLAALSLLFNFINMCQLDRVILV